MKCSHCNGTGVEPLKDADSYVRRLVEILSESSDRYVYKTASGGWAITYGGEVDDRIVQAAIKSGAIVDLYVGLFQGAAAGVGYALPAHAEAVRTAYLERQMRRMEKGKV